jgi:glycosyltransferase involved in cell wall biosynthesis
MSKIRVVHHSKTVGYSGTDRTAQLFCKHLAERGKYEPFLVYRAGDPSNQRLEILKEWLGEDHVIPYEWEPGDTGRRPPYMPARDNFHEVLIKIDPQIVHIHRSGYEEWPGFRYLAPKAKWIETNIFGFNDERRQMDLNLYISDYIRNTAMKTGNLEGPVLYNPIEQPVMEMTPENKAWARNTLLTVFNLPQDAILMGRVGRADNFDPIALRAMAIALKSFPHLYYFVVNGCDKWHEEATRLGIQGNVKFLQPIIDDVHLSSFYHGLDFYAHARSDGECCPCNIQEAMMHGLPVITHESGIYNGQSEILGMGGFCVPVGDFENYAKCMIALCENGVLADEEEVVKPIRNVFGRQARRRALGHFEASCVTSLLEGIYDWTLKNK